MTFLAFLLCAQIASGSPAKACNAGGSAVSATDSLAIRKRVVAMADDFLSAWPSVGAVTISWRDPKVADGSADNSVSIMPRSTVLDLSAAKPGDYWIEIIVTTPGRAPATAHRLLRVR